MSKDMQLVELAAKHLRAQIRAAERSEEKGGAQEASYWAGYLNSARQTLANLEMALNVRSAVEAGRPA